MCALRSVPSSSIWEKNTHVGGRGPNINHDRARKLLCSSSALLGHRYPSFFGLSAPFLVECVRCLLLSACAPCALPAEQLSSLTLSPSLWHCFAVCLFPPNVTIDRSPSLSLTIARFFALRDSPFVFVCLSSSSPSSSSRSIFVHFCALYSLSLC